MEQGFTIQRQEWMEEALEGLGMRRGFFSWRSWIEPHPIIENYRKL
jgi:hypothetical protein